MKYLFFHHINARETINEGTKRITYLEVQKICIESEKFATRQPADRSHHLINFFFALC